MRSRSGAGIESSTLAVPMNSTFDKSNGTARIIVAEGVVLFGVEDLEQRRERVALIARRELVHLVQHEHRVAAPRLAHRLRDVAGKGSDISAPMAANFRLVMHAAQTDAPELKAERLGDTLAEGGLADARRPHEAQYRTAAFGIQLAHREELQNAPFDLLQTIVVVIQYLARPLDVELLGVELRPRHRNQPIEVIARHRVFGRTLRHALEAREFAQRLFLRFLRHLASAIAFFRSSASAPVLPPSPSSFWI